MATSRRSTVVGMFDDPARAQMAVRELMDAGFTEDQVGVVTHDRSQTIRAESAADRGSKVAEGAAAGAAAGAGAGALWALGIMAGVLNPIGPVIVGGGWLASILLSAAGGAAAVGIVGALIGLGIPEEEARYYEGELKAGRTMVTVRADGRYDEAFGILRRHGAYDLSHRAAPAGAVASDAAAPWESGRVTGSVGGAGVPGHQTLDVPVSGTDVRGGSSATTGPSRRGTDR